MKANEVKAILISNNLQFSTEGFIPCEYFRCKVELNKENNRYITLTVNEELCRTAFTLFEDRKLILADEVDSRLLMTEITKVLSSNTLF